jgi:hypothetical protein
VPQRVFTFTGAEKVITIESPGANSLGCVAVAGSSCNPVIENGATTAKSELVAEP